MGSLLIREEKKELGPFKEQKEERRAPRASFNSSEKRKAP